MAKVYFLYRSTKAKAPLHVRIQLESNKEQMGAKTNIFVEKEIWEKRKTSRARLNGIQKNSLTDLLNRTDELENFILKAYEKELPTIKNKYWLKQTLTDFYDSKVKTDYPTNLIEFIEFYIEERKKNNDIKLSQIKRINTTKNKLIRIENESNKKFRIKDVNENFKNLYREFCSKHKYSINTQSNELDRIKTICRYAQKKGIEIYENISDLKIKSEKTPKIYLTIEEIEKIKESELNTESLQNARDWLLISIYTGQRVSDFMKFTIENIITDKNNRTFIKFEQVKTRKDMYIPVSKDLRKLLEIRDNTFPRPISDQKYNDYIKEVCRISKIDKICQGKKRICIADDTKKSDKTDYRSIVGDFPKWELVSSHIGRRTFATINYGKIPTPYLMYITGHSSERELINYVSLPDYEKAKQAFEYFNM